MQFLKLKVRGKPTHKTLELNPYATKPSPLHGSHLPTCEARLTDAIIAVDAIVADTKGTGVAGTIINVDFAVYTCREGNRAGSRHYCQVPLPNSSPTPTHTPVSDSRHSPKPHLWFPEDSGRGTCPPSLGICHHSGRAGCDTHPPGSHSVCPCSLEHKHMRS